MGLQVMAVHWEPTQAIFRTTALQPGEWAMAAAVAASGLLYGEVSRAIADRVGRNRR